jgi:hypothetical protein
LENLAIRLWLDPARIDESKRSPAPIRIRVQAVASYPGHVLNNREPPTGKLIKQSGLPYIRPPDYRDDWFLFQVFTSSADDVLKRGVS